MKLKLNNDVINEPMHKDESLLESGMSVKGNNESPLDNLPGDLPDPADALIKNSIQSQTEMVNIEESAQTDAVKLYPDNETEKHDEAGNIVEAFAGMVDISDPDDVLSANFRIKKSKLAADVVRGKKINKKDMQKLGLKHERRKIPAIVWIIVVFLAIIFTLVNPLKISFLMPVSNAAEDIKDAIMGKVFTISFSVDEDSNNQSTSDAVYSESFLKSHNDRGNGFTVEYLINVDDTAMNRAIAFIPAKSNQDTSAEIDDLKTAFESFDVKHNEETVEVKRECLTSGGAFADYGLGVGENDPCLIVSFSGFKEPGAYVLEINMPYQQFVDTYLNGDFVIKEAKYK